jgi:hypothetical protein
MGHDFSIRKSIKAEQSYECFGVCGNSGNYACDLVQGVLMPKRFQSSLYITYNNSKMWYVALKNIGHDTECVGEWLDKAKCSSVEPVLTKCFCELFSKPEIYEPLQPSIDIESGKRWGGYDDLLEKLQSLISACRKYPKGVIRDSC